MKTMLNFVYGVFDRVFGDRRSCNRDSQLMGMYLSQTNSKNTFVSEFQETRQRRNGKYSLTRERE